MQKLNETKIKLKAKKVLSNFAQNLIETRKGLSYTEYP